VSQLPDPNAITVVGPGIIKPLRDCTPEEVQMAMERLARLGARQLAAIAAVERGRKPKCGYEDPAGTFCEEDAGLFRLAESLDPDPATGIPMFLCARHRPLYEI